LPGIALILIAVGSASACGSVTAIEQSDACAGDAGGGCSPAAATGAGTAGRNAAKDPASARDAGTPAAGQVVMLPCTVCARADACCKAEGLGGCDYTAACAAASTTDEQQLRIALCQAAIDPKSSKGGPHCAPRRGEVQ